MKRILLAKHRVSRDDLAFEQQRLEKFQCRFVFVRRERHLNLPSPAIIRNACEYAQQAPQCGNTQACLSLSENVIRSKAERTIRSSFHQIKQ